MMGCLKSVKGSLPLALLFIIMLSVAISVMLRIYYAESPMSIARLTRLHARQRAEMALYEALNRFRIYYQDFDGYYWDAAAWADNISVPQPDPPGTRDIDIDEIPVTIDVVRDGLTGRIKVTAKVRYTGSDRLLGHFMRVEPP